MKLRYFLFLSLLPALMVTSCVKDDIYNGPATINSVAFTPGTVTPDDNVTVNAIATAVQGIQSVSLFYKVNTGTYNQADMIAGADNRYSVTIPKQADKAVVTFYIAVTTKGSIVNKSAEKSYTVGAIVPNYAAIILNEVDGNKKFVELYNNSDLPVNISGMTIIKNGTSLKNENGTPNWVAPAGIIIPGRGYGIIKCDSYSATADAAAVIIGAVGDGMSAKQTLQLELTKPDGTVLNTFQRGSSPWGVTISAIVATDSYSRSPDGTGAWKTALSTPGKANGAATGTIPSL